MKKDAAKEKRGSVSSRASREAREEAVASADARIAARAPLPEPPWARTAVAALLVVSSLLLGVRLYAAWVVGFGDSEALYACWAAHPQPAYLDHPGLIGLVARALGEGATPTPLRSHVLTSNIATLVPWAAYFTARAAGADRGRAAIAGLVLALVPETAVGLFALTPDLLLAPAWLGTIALAAVALRAPAGSTRSATAFLGAGLLAGTACAAKVSGGLLIATLIASYLWITFARDGSAIESGARDGNEDRAAVRTIWPWAGVAAGLVVVSPIVLYEAKTGWPMLRHRFVDTQTGAGVALKNVGALLGGQLLYVSPIFVLLAFLAARDLYRHRGRDEISRLLFLAFAVPLVPLLFLCLWSPVAEPHWIAPALLALPIHVARRAEGIATRRMFIAACSVAALLTVLVYGWVLVPESAKLLPASADPKVDITSELYGWPRALESAKEQMVGAATPFDPEGREVVVVGPHWTICAQLQAGMPGVRVGCATPMKDDFDGWMPRDQWRKAEHVLFVTDNRFPGDGAEQLPAHVRSSQSRVRIMRGGRTSRMFELYLYERRAHGSL